MNHSINLCQSRGNPEIGYVGILQAPAPHYIVRQALIGQTGGIIFMSVALDGSIFDAPAEDVTIFYIGLFAK
jgi:hypothetical protein